MSDPVTRPLDRKPRSGITPAFGPDASAAAIAESRYILELGDDWDEEGSPGYAEATWRRATGFVARCVSHAVERLGLPPVAPRITHGPDGSIDVLWRTPTREFLLNVPADEEQLAEFYGDDLRGQQSIRGALNTGHPNEWLLAWLAA